MTTHACDEPQGRRSNSEPGSTPTPLRAGWPGLVLLLALASGPTALIAQQVVQLPPADRQLDVRIDPAFEVGGRNAPGWAQFTEPAALAFDGSGNLHILDLRHHALVKVDRSGGLVHQFIRQGDGPGEITRAGGFGVLPNGRVMIIDAGRRTLSWFAPTGEALRSVPFDPARGGIPTPPLAPHPSGGFVSLQTATIMEGPAPVGAARGGSAWPISLFPEEGEPRRVFQAWRPPAPEVTGPPIRSGQGTVTIGQGPGGRVFDPAPSFGVLPDGRIVVADTTTWTIRVASPDGRLERTLHRAVPPRNVTRADREAELERRRTQLLSGGGPRVTVSTTSASGGVQQMDQEQIRRNLLAQLDLLQFAEVIPAISRIRTDPEGRIWVERPGRRLGEPGPIDVLSAEGSYLGTIPAGTLPFPMAMGPGGLVAWVETDALEVPTVVVRRVSFPAR